MQNVFLKFNNFLLITNPATSKTSEVASIKTTFAGSYPQVVCEEEDI